MAGERVKAAFVPTWRPSFSGSWQWDATPGRCQSPPMSFDIPVTTRLTPTGIPCMNDLPEWPAAAFSKHDPSPDGLFYDTPRLVTHIDATAVAAVTHLYRQLLPPGGVILDLMSSWVSHLPDDIAYGTVIGHGMNAEELAANPRLTRWFVQNLNADSRLPVETAGVDAVLMCVGVQYLQQPVAVLREVRRVLRPAAPVIITFSNRCFPTKAVALWGALGGADRLRLVSLYGQRAGFSVIEARDVVAEGRGTDPLHAVVCRSGM